jgi:hypothetical protein
MYDAVKWIKNRLHESAVCREEVGKQQDIKVIIANVDSKQKGQTKTSTFPLGLF